MGGGEGRWLQKKGRDVFCLKLYSKVYYYSYHSWFLIVFLLSVAVRGKRCPAGEVGKRFLVAGIDDASESAAAVLNHALANVLPLAVRGPSGTRPWARNCKRDRSDELFGKTGARGIICLVTAAAAAAVDLPTYLPTCVVVVSEGVPGTTVKQTDTATSTLWLCRPAERGKRERER